MCLVSYTLIDVVPCPEGKMSRKFLLLECRSSVRHVLFHACTCNKYNSVSWRCTSISSYVWSFSTCRGHVDLPFLRQVVWRVVGLEMNPLPGGQVQPVQVCAVDVARCPPKYVQKAIYNNHCLKKERYKQTSVSTIFQIPTFNLNQSQSHGRVIYEVTCPYILLGFFPRQLSSDHRLYFTLQTWTSLPLFSPKGIPVPPNTRRLFPCKTAKATQEHQSQFYTFCNRKLDCLCVMFKQCFTWHGRQLCWHIAVCLDLLPAARGKVVPPQLPEQGVVFILWASWLVVVGVVPSKHIKVCVVGNTAMPTAGRGSTVAWRGRNIF